LAWPIPDLTHPDTAALIVLASILGDGRSSRCYRRLREELGWVHSVGASTYTPAREGLFAVHAVDPEHGEAAEAEAPCD
jgi:zinc protease